MDSLRSIHVPTQIKRAHRWRSLLYLSFVLAAFGAKLWIIARYGNATPFWDDWDAQAVNLFIPYYDSTLSIQNFLTPANEHRLLPTRLLSVALISANGLWDPILQMIVNAAIHVALGVGILMVFNKHLDRLAFAGLAILTVMLVAVPNATENLLVELQTHFYCVLLFGCIAIFLIAGKSGFSALGILGIAAAALSFLSLASGALVFLACGGVVITKRVLRVESGWRPWALAAVLFACFVLALLVTPTIVANEALGAHSLQEFLKAFLRQAAWPISHRIKLSALVVNAPLVVVAWRTLRKPPPSNNIAWVLLALGLWNGLQFAALAYGRAAMSEASRYLDICALGLIINFICAAIISDTGRKRLLAASWVVAIVIGWACQTAIDVPKQLRQRYSTSVQQEKNVRAFLATGQFLPGASGADLSLPYPDATRLANLLSDARVRRFLPSNLQDAVVGKRLPDAAPIRRDRLGGFRDALLAAGPYLAGVGFLLLLLSVLMVSLAGALRTPTESKSVSL